MSAALALWATRSTRRRVLTPEPVGVELAAAGWTAVDAWAWRDPEDGGVLGWPLAMAAVRRRARRGA